MSEEQLDFVLAWLFPKSKEKTGKSIQEDFEEMIGGVQAFLRVQCKRNITLIDKTGFRFRSLNSAFNFQ